MNKHYRLLVVDVDGTLIGKNRDIAAEDKEALARAGDSGIQVSLSTGRVVQSSLKIINQLSLEGYHIFSDGALVSNPKSGDEVYIKLISKELVRQIIDFVHLNKMNFDLFSVTHFFVERETWVSDIRRDYFGLEPTVVDFSQLWQKERIIKGTLVVRSDEEKAEAARFCRRFKDRLSFSLTKTPAYPEVDFVNVLAPGVSKGEAMEVLALHLGMALSEVIAIGDGSNDVSLLSRVGLAIAMGNAHDELKAVADYVTRDIDHHGVAEAIKKFLL